MSTVQVSLQGRETIADGTMAFHLAKPANFLFKPGQAIDLILPSLAASDATNSRHTFSLVSAPFQDHLTVATRMRDSPYKRALKALPDGTELEVDGPFGSLTLHRDRARAAIFIAGGIGITPFVSILRQAARESPPRSLALVYSNRRPEDAAFLAELQQFEQKMEGFRLLATMSAADQAKTPWAGPTGIINAELLKCAADQLSSPIYYLAGPPTMVAAMHVLLNQTGIDDDIRSEDFFGY